MVSIYLPPSLTLRSCFGCGISGTKMFVCIQTGHKGGMMEGREGSICFRGRDEQWNFMCGEIEVTVYGSK